MKESMEEITHFDLNITYTKGEKVCYNNKYWEYWPNEKQAPYSLAVFPSNETGWRLEKEKTTPEDFVNENIYIYASEEESYKYLKYYKVLKAIELARKDERGKTVKDCQEALLKQLHKMVYSNGYPIEGVAKATILMLDKLVLTPDKEGEGNE